MNFFEFAGSHPVLTFFLFVVVGNTLVEIVKAIRRVPEGEDT